MLPPLLPSPLLWPQGSKHLASQPNLLTTLDDMVAMSTTTQPHGMDVPLLAAQMLRALLSSSVTAKINLISQGVRGYLTGIQNQFDHFKDVQAVVGHCFDLIG